MAAPTLILHTSSTQGIGILPLAISNDRKTLLYARRDDLFTERPDPLPIGTAFRLDIASGESKPLFDGTGCPCLVAAAPDSHIFARLEPASQRGNQTGYNLRVGDWLLGTESLIPQPSTPQPGNRGPAWLILSRDGQQAAYIAAKDASTARPYVLMLVDIAAKTQRALITNLRDNLRPLAFSDDDTAVVLVGVDKPGTYKVPLSGGAMVQVSAYSWLGALGRN